VNYPTKIRVAHTPAGLPYSAQLLVPAVPHCQRE